MKRLRLVAHGAVVGALALAVGACGGPSEAPRVEFRVLVDGSGAVPVTTDLGYEVEVDSVRVVVEDLVFTVAGEVHASSPGLLGLVIPLAHAHPGHAQGGEVTGELPGEFVIDWPDDDAKELGTATLIAADYTATDFTFGRGSIVELGVDDPLAGHTAVITGQATKDGATTTFTIIVDSPDDRTLIGAPFEAQISERTDGELWFHFDTVDPIEGDTVFDNIDFQALEGAVDGDVLIAEDDDAVEDAYNTFRRAFQSHDHYGVTLKLSE